LHWTVITVPFDPTKAWPKRQRLRVRGTINGFAFRTSLFRARDTSYILLVNRKMQKQAGVRQGHVAAVVLEPDLEERPQSTPRELEKLLRQDRALRRFYEQLSDSMRKAIIDQIEQPERGSARGTGGAVGGANDAGHRWRAGDAAHSRGSVSASSSRARRVAGHDSDPASGSPDGHLLLSKSGIAAEAGAEGD
jgi:hypothetical protein